MKRRKIVVRVGVGLCLLYILSYLILTLRGHYEPAAYGPIKGDGDSFILAPKSGFGYHWNPFGTDTMAPDVDHEWAFQLGRIYLPLVYLDKKLWHTKKEMNEVGDGRHRVMHFFDWSTKTYRDINLN